MIISSILRIVKINTQKERFRLNFTSIVNLPITKHIDLEIGYVLYANMPHEEINWEIVSVGSKYMISNEGK